VSAKKCRRCDECADAEHHILSFESYAEVEPEHPAAKAGHVAWHPCKHCPAYLPLTEEVMDLLDADEDMDPLDADIAKHVIVPGSAA
jgi:hypothetical protein